MTVDSQIVRIRELTEILDPHAFRARIGSLKRDGLPARSIPEGSHSSETPIPKTDAEDRRFDAVAREYRRRLNSALRQLARALELETGVLPDRHKTAREWEKHREELSRAAAELVSARATPCGNPNCQRIVEHTENDPLTQGRCNACYVWRRRHGGKERPRTICVADHERRLTKEHRG